MNASFPNEDRLLQLLVDRATEGLSGSHHEELEQLLQGDADPALQSIDLAAAAANLAMLTSRPKPLPARVRARLSSDAHSFFAPLPMAPVSGAGSKHQVSRKVVPLHWARLGWHAAAAALLIAIVGWWHVLVPATPATIDEEYARFVQRSPDLLRAAWTPQLQEFSQVAGEVVWSDAAQSGFMIFTGLRSNPAQSQYQLWIVDPARDERPVDGGVFDAPRAEGRLIVPFTAKLAVLKPAAFALTLEKKGGVVVSDGPLLVVASTKG